MMRTVLAIIVYLCSAVQATAQDRYFLCIQSEDKQPFYVRVSNKTWSSSAVGNLVVSGLGDSTYQVLVGFPQGKYPEQSFLVTFNRKDLGYTLKKGGDQGWTLLNWENGERLSPRAGQAVETIWYGERKKDDAFTHMMAAVVNDSAILYVASAKDLPGKQEVFATANPAPDIKKDSAMAGSAVAATVTDTIDAALAAQVTADTARLAAVHTGQTLIDSAIVKPDSALAMKTNEAVASGLATVKDSAAAVAEKAGPILVYTAPKPSVTLVKDHILPGGRNMLFTDSSVAGLDSISVIIDADPDTIKNMALEQATKPAATSPVKPGSPATDTTSKAAGNPVAATTPEISAPAQFTPAASTEGKKDAVDAPEKKKMVMINSDCSNFATDNDIDKLRVKILDEPTIESKLASTKKLFKSKCIYTRQIRALSELFMNDEAQYRFFEQCYPFTADTSEFRSLISLLSEETYIARFKTLVRMND